MPAARQHFEPASNSGTSSRTCHTVTNSSSTSSSALTHISCSSRCAVRVLQAAAVLRAVLDSGRLFAGYAHESVPCIFATHVPYVVQVETLQAELAAARQAVQNAQAEAASLRCDSSQRHLCGSACLQYERPAEGDIVCRTFPPILSPATCCRRAGEEGEAAVFQLHEVQLQLDDARASLQALQRQMPRFDSRQQQPQLSPQAGSTAGANDDEDGGDGPRPQQLPHCFRQRALRRPGASAAAAAADADALQAARQQLAAQGRQLAKQVR